MFPSKRINTRKNLLHKISKAEIKNSVFRRILLRSAKAYVNQFLPLPNVCYSPSTICIECL